MDVDAIKSSASLVQIAGRDTKLTRRNNEYHGCCPLHNESTPSFTVFNGKKGEQFHCFGCGESGDVIEYIMKTRGVKFVEACRIIAGDLAVDGLKKRDLPERVDKYAGITPAPDAPRIEGKQLEVYNPNLGEDGNVKGWKRVRFAMAFEYAPGMAVLRIEMKDGGKWTPQIMWCTTPDGKTGWAYMPMPEPRPLYGLTDAKQVIVVQGEKKADQLRARFTGKRCVVCSSGGDNAVAKSDWEQLTGRDVIIWPDADDSGREAARYVAQRLKGKASRVRIMRTDDLPRK